VADIQFIREHLLFTSRHLLAFIRLVALTVLLVRYGFCFSVLKHEVSFVSQLVMALGKALLEHKPRQPTTRIC
jgi:hypothetical protein